jgi:hypothetical protein
LRSFIQNNKNGILTTAIFHLVLLIVFLLSKIATLHDGYEEFVMIEFPEPVTREEKVKKVDLSEIIPELRQNRRNVAVNTAEEFQKEISTEEYIKQLKEELSINDPEEGWQAKLEEKYKVKNEDQGQQEMANPDIDPNETNVSYHLENRFARYVHIPVYKCLGNATIVLSITVDEKGGVVNSALDASLSKNINECFVNEAMDAARRSRFNADFSAPARQKGTITYKFVAQ